MESELFLLLITGLLSARGQEPGHCIFYDVCGWDPDYEDGIGGNQVHFLNCTFDGPAKRASQEQLEILEEVCPHLYPGGSRTSAAASRSSWT